MTTAIGSEAELDAAEDVPLAGPVRTGCLDDLLGDSLEGGGEDDHREPGRRPDVSPDQGVVDEVLAPVPRLRLAAEERDQRIQRADVGVRVKTNFQMIATAVAEIAIGMKTIALRNAS